MKSNELERRMGLWGFISACGVALSLSLVSPVQAFVGSSSLAKPIMHQTSSLHVSPVLFGLRGGFGRGGFGGGLRGGFGRGRIGGFGGFRRPRLGGLGRPGLGLRRGFRPGRRPGFRPGRRPGFRPGRVRRPRGRRFFGRRFAGVMLGTAIGVAIAGTAPYPPHSNLCWYWSNASKKYGYWYYCTEPTY